LREEVSCKAELIVRTIQEPKEAETSEGSQDVNWGPVEVGRRYGKLQSYNFIDCEGEAIMIRLLNE
jgi:hypothetical protein